MPNGDVIASIATGQLNPPHVPAIKAHIFADHSLDRTLLSLADFCNRGCHVILTATDITINAADGSQVLHSYKHPLDRLWPICFNSQVSPHPPTAQAFAAIHHELNADYVNFCHAMLGSPPVSSLLRALRRGYLSSLPRLTATMVAANPPVSIATARGHLDLTRQGQRSTRPHKQSKALLLAAAAISTNSTKPVDIAAATMLPDEVDLEPDAFIKIIDLSKHDDANHSDITGRFNIPSWRGNNYVLVSVYKGYVYGVAMPSRKHKESQLKAYETVYAHLKSLGHCPTIQRMDNETSAVLDRFFKDNNITVQLVPPHNHRANKAERAIRDYKNHVIATLGTVHSSFPLNLWDELLPQINITINLLRPYSPQPSMSAYEGIHGSKFDFAAHPMAPCGTRVLIHESPATRASWSPHGTPGFYLGPALSGHYRSFNVFAVSTRAVRVTDTVAWFPEQFKMPGSSTVELIHAAMTDLATAFTSLAASSVLSSTQRPRFEHLQNTITSAIKEASAMFLSPATTSTDSNPLLRMTTTAVADTKCVPEQRVVPDTVVHHEEKTQQQLQLPLVPHTRPLSPSTSPPPGITHPTMLPVTRSDQRVVVAATNDPPSATSNSPHHPHGDAADDQVTTMTPPQSSPAIPIQRMQTKASRRRNKTTKAVSDRVPSISSERERIKHVFAARRSGRRRMRPVRYDHHFTQHLAYAMRTDSADAFFERARANAALNLAPDGKPLTYWKAKKGPNAENWFVAEGEELCRLIDSQTMRAILLSEQPLSRRGDTTYYNPQTKEKLAADGTVTYRIRGTAGGDGINYPGDVSARTAEMEVVKILFHSAASDRAKRQGGSMLTADIKDFYLGTDLERPEYVRIPLRYIPDSVLDKYKLRSYIDRKSILFEINKCMYGLPQAGFLSQRRLIAHLAEHGYKQDLNVPCLFLHAERGTAFTLVVDDFAVKYKTKADADHFIATLEQHYQLKVDWKASKYLGFTVEFDDLAQTVSLSMPEYVPKMLARFYPDTVLRGAASPAVYTPPDYGNRVQHVAVDNSPALTPAEIHRLQEMIGSLLFYARAIDNTMLTAVNHVSSDQAKPTQQVLSAAHRIMQYAAAYPCHKLVYKACDMVLYIQSDASYLSRSNARSVAGGLLYCSNNDDTETINGAILAVSCIIPTVCSAVSEAEYAACFINAQHGVWLRTILQALGYKQPVTQLLCDNRCAVGIANDNIKVKRSKAIDMRYHWVRDRIRQGIFNVYWRKGTDNLADFFTKALAVYRHQDLKPLLVHSPLQPDNPSLPNRARRSQEYHLANLSFSI